MFFPERFKVSAVTVFAAVYNGFSHCAGVRVYVRLCEKQFCIFEQRGFCSVEFFECFVNCRLLLFGKTCAFQAAFVDCAYQRRIMPAYNNERRNIVVEARKPGRIAPSADGNELMNLDGAAEPDAGFYFAVTADLRIVAEDGFVLDDAVVADVNAYHYHIVIAYFCDAVGSYARMYGNAFADDVAITDFERAEGRIGLCAEHLRVSADDAIGIKYIISACSHAFADNDTGVEDAAGTDFSAGVDKTIRPDDNIVGKFCIFFYDGGRMYFTHLVFCPLIPQLYFFFNIVKFPNI
jgi:hypothetical protein